MAETVTPWAHMLQELTGPIAAEIERSTPQPEGSAGYSILPGLRCGPSRPFALGSCLSALKARPCLWCRRAICGVAPAVAAANKALSTALPEDAADVGSLTMAAAELECVVINVLTLAQGVAAGSAGRQDLVFRAFTCGVVVLDSGSLAYRLQGLPYTAMPAHLKALHTLLAGLSDFESEESGARAVAVLRATTFTPEAIRDALRAVACVEKVAGEHPVWRGRIACWPSVTVYLGPTCKPLSRNCCRHGVFLVRSME